VLRIAYRALGLLLQKNRFQGRLEQGPNSGCWFTMAPWELYPQPLRVKGCDKHAERGNMASAPKACHQR